MYPSAISEKSLERNWRIERVMSNHTKRWKGALFCNSVNSIISSNKFKENNYLKLIISFNISNKTFMQKGTDQRPFNFFSFGTQNQFAYLKVYCIASINWLKIDINWTKKTKKNTISRETFTEAVVQKCS